MRYYTDIGELFFELFFLDLLWDDFIFDSILLPCFSFFSYFSAGKADDVDLLLRFSCFSACLAFLLFLLLCLFLFFLPSFLFWLSCFPAFPDTFCHRLPTMGIVLLLQILMLLLLMRLNGLNTVVSHEAACGGGAAPSPAPLRAWG